MYILGAWEENSEFVFIIVMNIYRVLSFSHTMPSPIPQLDNNCLLLNNKKASLCILRNNEKYVVNIPILDIHESNHAFLLQQPVTRKMIECQLLLTRCIFSESRVITMKAS